MGDVCVGADGQPLPFALSNTGAEPRAGDELVSKHLKPTGDLSAGLVFWQRSVRLWTTVGWPSVWPWGLEPP